MVFWLGCVGFGFGVCRVGCFCGVECFTVVGVLWGFCGWVWVFGVVLIRLVGV